MLGLILGKIAEPTFAQAMQVTYFDSLEYLSRPIGLALSLAGLATIAANVYNALKGRGFQLDPKHKEVPVVY